MKADSPNLAKAIKQALALQETIGQLCTEADPVAIFVVQQCVLPSEGVGMTLINLKKGLEEREALEAEGDLGN